MLVKNIFKMSICKILSSELIANVIGRTVRGREEIDIRLEVSYGFCIKSERRN